MRDQQEKKCLNIGSSSFFCLRFISKEKGNKMFLKKGI